ncbi:MAG: hypothetical protein IJP31_09310 [Lachnospiraceae bacterium]|nr:hypothetical protein [Lachnospiraceae bacterium]
MVICPNCGGSFEEEHSSCPYCGYIYEPGAYRKYMENLHDIREDLEELGEETGDIYKKEAGKTVKKTAVIFLILLFLLLFAGLSLFGLHRLLDYSEDEDQLKERIIREHQMREERE